ncbi:MAG: hypothetical protein EDX89_14995 [Acidobacteria bacterium]|nr:MAG: hypothetical protein EDX89_14995 [Acidobacteriota bacterium]
MRPRAALLALLLVAPALVASPEEPPRRVVLVSFDGAGGLERLRQSAAGTFGPDGFEKAGRIGLAADRLVVVTPSLTAVSHASISTGASPDRTGIVSNWYLPAGRPVGQRVSGFEETPAVETLWEAAARQGKRVAALSWPGVSAAGPRQRTALGFLWVEPRERSFVIRVPGAALTEAAFALPLGVRSFSPPRALPVRSPHEGEAGGALAGLAFAIVDGTDDGQRNYDSLVVLSRDGQLVARARAAEWFALSERRAEDRGDEDVLVGRWCRLVALSPDLSTVSLYVGGLGSTEAWPADFRRTLDREAGFWPGAPDPLLLHESPPDRRGFVEQAARFSRFFVAAFDVADRRGDWDLLLAYQPVLDEAQHVLGPPGAGGEGAGERARLDAAALREVWRVADEAAAGYLRFAPRGDVLVVSDHGMRPIRRVLNVAELFRRNGWLRAGAPAAGRPQVAADSPVDVTASGGAAFVAVNRAGQRPGGVVTDERADALLAEMKGVLRAMTDPEGEPLFEAVLGREEARPLGLDHPNSGDLVLLARDGTGLRASLPASPDAPLLSTSELTAQHGFGPDPELDGLFFHVGAGIAPERVETFPSVGIAGRVAGRLGIQPPGELP